MIFDEDFKNDEELIWKLASLSSEDGFDIPCTLWVRTNPEGKSNTLLGVPRLYLEVEKERLYAVSIEATPRLLDDEAFVLPEVFEQLSCWILRHKEALLRHWYGKTTSATFFREIAEDEKSILA